VTARAVIVGTGVAGVSAAASMRSVGFDGEIVLIGDEPELPYRRPPISKEVLVGTKTLDQIRIKPAAWFAEQDIELRTGVRVTAIDPAARRVRLDDAELGFDRLLLATGGSPRRLAPEIDGILTLRGAADVAALRTALMPGERVVIVGAGLIGSEVAASARALGCDVTLLESAPQPLPRVLPAELGQMYVALHKENGTDLHVDVTVAAIERAVGDLRVTATDGRSWTGSRVVVAIGMRPRTRLAELAGLEVADGIVVDGQGRTSALDVFAAGDVANMPNLVLGGRHRVEHWQGAQNHGASVGKTMAGVGSEFVEVPWCWSDQYGANLQITGWPHLSDAVHVRGSVAERDFCAFFTDAGVLVGAVGMARPADVRAARTLIAARAAVRPSALVDLGVAVGDSVQ
jgi:NADPH-dependent 2,4-dienoyl-CoA reductase/sulfur reductase-like enzyme